jgi:hypothetical protein
MAANALALLATLHPEPTVLALQRHSGSIEQFDLQGLL